MANIFSLNETDYHTGDTVRVHLNVSEGDKTRIQIFEGLIIKIRGEGHNKSFTVRKIGANSIGVERILPVMSPSIDKIEVKAEGNVRRAKLYYLRDRIGKRALKVKVKTKETKASQAAKTAKLASDAKKVEAKPKAAPKKASPKTAKGKAGGTASKKAASK